MCKQIRLGLAMTIACLVLSRGTLAIASSETPLPLDAAEISEQLQHLPGWATDGQQISCTYEFGNFVEAIAFVNQLVVPAEAAGHHPDIAISYNKVTIYLSTHDAGGLTQQDFALADRIAHLPASATLSCLAPNSSH